MSEVKLEKIGEEKPKYKEFAEISVSRKSTKKVGENYEGIEYGYRLNKDITGCDPIEIEGIMTITRESMNRNLDEAISNFWKPKKFILPEKGSEMKTDSKPQIQGVWQESKTGKSEWCTLEDLKAINIDLFKLLQETNPISWKNAIPYEGYRYCLFGDNKDRVSRVKLK